jgi:hypothetical protein
VELKVSARPVSLGVTSAWQLLGYCLLDFPDEFQITDVAIFHARYAYLASWNLEDLLARFAGAPMRLAQIRSDFQALLKSSQPR